MLQDFNDYIYGNKVEYFRCSNKFIIVNVSSLYFKKVLLRGKMFIVFKVLNFGKIDI